MLTASHLTVSIAGTPILRKVSFYFGESQTIALIGRNGAGKTTTLRTIMGLTEPEAGTLDFLGADLSAVPAFRRPGLGIGYAPEDRRLFSSFTVEDNIRLPGRVAALSAAEIERRLERAYDILPEVKEMAARPAGAVSGGQGKMVALARALMLGTKILLLDEPFQGLAPVLAQRYGQALRRLRELDRTLTIVITESNPALLKHFAERTFVIERGEIVEAQLQGAAS
jgi:branched-chain amino acid transport system ATP-binding protein